MAYLGTQPNDVKKNTGLYTPSEILELTKDGSWGGSLELIEEQTYSSAVANIDFLAIQENKFDVHLMQYSNIQNSGGASADLCVRFYESGVLETASVYQWANQVGVGTGTFYASRTTGNAYLQFMTGANIGNSTNESGNAYCYFYNLTDSSKYSFMTHQCISTYDTNGMNMNFGSGVMPQASAVDGIQLILNGGNIDTADISLYGIAES